MTTLNISLPESMKSFVDGQVSQGGYSSSSEYVRALIRKEQEERSRAALEAELLAGLASGPSSEMTAKDWAGLRQRVLGRRKTRSRK